LTIIRLYLQLEELSERAIYLRRTYIGRTSLYSRLQKGLFRVMDRPSWWFYTPQRVRAYAYNDAPQDVQQDPLFMAVCARHPAEEFSEHCQRELRLTSSQIDALAAVHHEREAWLADWRPWLSFSSQAAWVLAAAAVISRAIPAQVIRRLDWNYADYLWYTTLALGLALLVLVVGRVLVRSKFRDRKDAIALTGLVLALLRAKSEGDADESAEPQARGTTALGT
jgi:hypothetical protein